MTLRLRLSQTALSRNVTHSGRVPRSAAARTRQNAGKRATSGHYGELLGGECTEPLVNAPASFMAPSDVNISLPLKGITPAQLGFIRIHDIQPLLINKRSGGAFCAFRNIPALTFVSPY